MESAQDNQGRILLVDDESAILRTFRYCLEDEAIAWPRPTAPPRPKPCCSAKYSTCASSIYAWARTTASTYWRRCASRHPGCAL